MRILLISSGYNGLCQRIHQELLLLGNEVSIELAISESVMLEAVDIYEPDFIICPFLKERVPAGIWKNYPCLIVHPGIEGDRGPSSLDWAVMDNLTEWGVTVLGAVEDMDAGDIWGTQNFPMRPASKASLYRQEVSSIACWLARLAVGNVQNKNFTPRPLDYDSPRVKGRWQPYMKQDVRQIDWSIDDTSTVIKKIRAADSSPGLLDEIGGQSVYLYGASKSEYLHGLPGELIAQSNEAICRATVDGAVWISHLKLAKGRIKLPATMVLESMNLGSNYARLPEIQSDCFAERDQGYQDIGYCEKGEVGYLSFNFYNGAMNTGQCLRLTSTIATVKKRDIKVLVLMGGDDFWSNGIHLNCIEAAASAADESWANINAMNDLVKEIINTPRQVTVSALRNNAGAGGAVLPLACDKVVIRDGVILNLHYQTMGLYGSEYWTYLLPRRVGLQKAHSIMEDCLPTHARSALEIGIADHLISEDWQEYHSEMEKYCEALSKQSTWQKLLRLKAEHRKTDEKEKPLQEYRDHELQHMFNSFYNEKSDYHQARKDFVNKIPASETPARIAIHRREEFERFKKSG